MRAPCARMPAAQEACDETLDPPAASSPVASVAHRAGADSGCCRDRLWREYPCRGGAPRPGRRSGAVLSHVHDGLASIGRADRVIIPTQGSQLDSAAAGKAIRLIMQQEKAFNRKIPYAVLYTRTNPAIRPRTLKHIQEAFRRHGIFAFETHMHEREACRALFSFGGTRSTLDPAHVSERGRGQAQRAGVRARDRDAAAGVRRAGSRGRRDESRDGGVMNDRADPLGLTCPLLPARSRKPNRARRTFARLRRRPRFRAARP